MLELLLDVDAVVKLAAYGILDDVTHPGCNAACSNTAGVTAATRYVARNYLKRTASDPVGATNALNEFLNAAEEVEPNEFELRLAAELEELADRNDLELDAGESQLCAIALSRACPALLTGDKRAIAAAESLLSLVPELEMLCSRVACLEQAINLASQRLGGSVVRQRVVAEKNVDKAISICFQVTNPLEITDFKPRGLLSYINSVRESAPRLLMPGAYLAIPSVTQENSVGIE